MIADLMAEGDHKGCTDLISATIPVICGAAMEVPDKMLKSFLEAAGDQAARIFKPGAVTSGCKANNLASILNDIK